MVERAGMKHWKAKGVSTVVTTIRMTARGVREASYDNSVDCCYAVPVYNPVLQILRGGGAPTSRWAGPPTAGSGPSWAGWIQSRHCYCASGLLKLAGETRGRRGDMTGTGERGGEAEEWESRQAVTAVEERGRGDKRERKTRQNLPI